MAKKVVAEKKKTVAKVKWTPKIEMTLVADLAQHLHPNNPRQHPDFAISKLVKSIQEFGWTNPVLIDKNGRVLAGHARIAAAQKAGVKEVPVIQLPLSGAKADAYVIADNRLQQDTLWDPAVLHDMLEGLKLTNIDLTLTGFDLPEIDKILAPMIPATNEEIDEEEMEGEMKHSCPQCGFKW